MVIISYCATVCALVFWLASRTWTQKFFSIVPAIIFIYYLPTVSTTIGVLPSASPAYDWMRDYLLPFSLFILMITTDVPTIVKIGPKAILMMLFGTLGIVIGGPITLLVFQTFGPSDLLPPDTWKGLAALSGSWIGGGGNFAALKESVGAPESIISPIIIVDTFVGYTWMGVLLFLANYQTRIDRWNHAGSAVLDDLNSRMKDFQEDRARAIKLLDVSLVLAIGLLGAVCCRAGGKWIYALTDPWLSAAAPNVAAIFSDFTWLVILISTVGILLSFTPLRQLESAGASKLGYAALYLFLTSIGAKADLMEIIEAPALLAVGAVWILIHVGILFLGARLIRAPMFLVAVGSQANVGGAASAPIVAAAYYEAMAPVGLLMGVLGYVLGNYAGLLCAYLLKLVGG